MDPPDTLPANPTEVPTPALPKGYRVRTHRVKEFGPNVELYDCTVWHAGQQVLSSSGTAHMTAAIARRVGHFRAVDIANGATSWT